MDIIICLDDRNGMLFHHRRQSRDREVIRDMLQECAGRKLLVSPFSAGLFEKGARGVIVVDNPLSQAQNQDVCFIEAEDITPYRDSVESWIIYRWNRRYPADTWFSIDLHEDWKLAETTEFAGYSHEKITKEIYTR